MVFQLSKDDWKGCSGINVFDAYIFNAKEIDVLNSYIKKQRIWQGNRTDNSKTQ